MTLHGTAARRRLAVAAIGGLVAALAVPGAPATAAGHEMTKRVVARGLDNPRGVALGRDGAIYIAESGKGGGKLVEVGTAEQGVALCFGKTGGITRVAKGRQTRLASLPSFVGASEGPDGKPKCGGPEAGVAAVGPSEVAVLDRSSLWFTMGLGAPPEGRAAAGAVARKFGKVFRLRPDGSLQMKADLAAYEGANDPDGLGPDSNPYGITVAKDGSRLVVDAGGNDLLRVTKDGRIRLLATFPNLDPVPFEPPSCFDQLPPEVQQQFPPPGAPIPPQAVPTAVAVGPDGATYVGILSGFPFAKGAAKVYRIDKRTREVTTYAEGLTHVVGIAFHRGVLHAVEMTQDSLLEPEVCGNMVPGRVVAVHPDGRQHTVVDDLPLPGGIAVGERGAIYVTVNSILPGAGEVWRFAH